MASPSKYRASEVNHARSKLNGVLLTLQQKAEDSSSNSDSSDDGCVYSFPSGASRVKKDASMQKKRGGKTRRKRRRKEDGDNKDATYVMKLFDRSVDLAKFSFTSPLYPICRAWMQNEPNVDMSVLKTENAISNVEEEPQNEDTLEEEEQCITVLPPPIKIPNIQDYNNQDLRIATPMPTAEKLVVDEINDEPPNKDLLLSSHLSRWKEIRQKWKESSFLNEQRYRDSIGIIKSLKVVFE